MKFRIVKSTGIQLSLACTAALFGATRSADAQTWDGGSLIDSSLVTAANWNPDGVPGASADVIFAGSVRLAPVVSSTFQLNSLTFNNSAGAFVFGGTGTLNLKAGGLTNNDAQAQAFNNPVSFGLTANSTINAASGGLLLNGAVTVANTALTLDGANAITFGSTITGTTTISKTGTGAFNFAATATAIGADFILNAGTTTLTATGTTQTLAGTASIALNGSSAFIINESLTINGAQITRGTSASLSLAGGKSLTVQNGGDVIHSGGFSQSTAATINVAGAGSTFVMGGASDFRGGSTLNITAGGSAANPSSFIDLANGTSNATVLVDGAGSSFSAVSTGFWGHGGGNAQVTFSNAGSGSFGGITLTNGVVGSAGTINVLSGSSLTTGALGLAESSAAVTAALTVNGAGSTVTQTAVAAPLTIGAASSSTGTLNVQSGGTFTSSTGAITVNATGTVAIAGGIFNANGNMALNGQMTRDAAGGFNFAAGKTLTIQSGGDFVNAGDYTHNTASTVTVTGAGSTLSSIITSQLRFNGGSTLNLLAGGHATSGSLRFGADSGNATALVDGVGSLLASTNFGLTAGLAGNSATLTFSNGAVGTFATPMLLSATDAAGTNAAVSVLSGATVTAGGLSMANAVGAATATLSISGAGSIFETTGPGTIGAAAQSSAQVTITNGGSFRASPGTLTIAKTGTVAIDGGTFKATGNLTVNGGQLTRTATGTFELFADKSLTIQNGGDATFTGDHIQLNPSNLIINGSGSTFTTTGDFQWEGNSNLVVFVQVSGGGQLASGGALHLARNDTAVALTVNGTGSQISSATSSTSEWQAGVLFVNGASGNLGGLRLADVDFSAFTTGSFSVQSGSNVSMGNLAVATVTANNQGSVAVSGVGSAITQTGASTLTLGTFSTSAATLTVSNGGTFTSGTGNIALNTTGTINVDGGILDLKGPLILNGGDLNFNFGELRIADDFVIGAGGLLGTALTLDNAHTFSTSATTTIEPFRTLTLNGGTFRSGALVNLGNIVFNSGTLAITGAGGFHIGTGALGSNVRLGAGANLQVTDLTTIAGGALLTIDGGGFSGEAITNDGTIDHAKGVFQFTGTLNNSSAGRLFVGGLSSSAGAITNAGRITMRDGIGFLGGSGAITNTGLITGDGTIAKPVTNSTSGQLRAELGKTLVINGGVAPNQGTFSLQGGTLEFSSAITNSPGGMISGRGTLITNGLTNHGAMAFSGGNTDVFGDVTNAAGARIVTSGAGAVTTFFDDVVHSGLEIFTGENASTVFFGDQTGVGSFTGTGTVYFIGDLLPGASPASISFGGDLVLGSFARTVIEIGGPTPGSQHDRLSVADTMFPGGVLEINLINGFVPAAGQSFDVIDAANSTGSFSSIVLPALPSGLFWRTDFLATQGVLHVGVVPATFGEFAAAYGLTQGTTGDDDGDQVTNVMEFLLGSHPLDPASIPYQSFTRDGQQSVYRFALPEFPPTSAGFVVKSSPDLQTWNTLSTKSGLNPWSAGIVTGSPVAGFVTMTLEEMDSAPRRFYRLGARSE